MGGSSPNFLNYLGCTNDLSGARWNRFPHRAQGAAQIPGVGPTAACTRDSPGSRAPSRASSVGNGNRAASRDIVTEEEQRLGYGGAEVRGAD